MKKISIVFILFLLVIICVCFRPKDERHRIIAVKSANAFYVDFNENGSPDDDELIEMYYVRGFEPNIATEHTTKKESAMLSYSAGKFASEALLNKHAFLVYDEKHRLKRVYAGHKEYGKLLLEHGLGTINKSVESAYKDDETAIKKELKNAEKLDLVSYNPFSGKYHTLDCKYAFQGATIVILPFSELNKSSIPCKICHITEEEPPKPEKYPRIEHENYSPAYKDAEIELYISDFTKYYYPSSKCVVTACQSLLREINSAKNSIDFAIYGVSSQPEVMTALLNAQKRGVNVRWVYDLDAKGESIYSDTKNLASALKNSSGDYFSPENKSKYSNSIMHNKFFIFDDKKVWTGSANISETDMSGFNSNAAALINSPEIAEIYKEEFQQMYDGKYHKFKEKINAPRTHKAGNSTISLYFSPSDKIIETEMIPLVKNAKKYIYVPVFVITHKNLINELILAKKRGVDVKIILDATGAANKYSPVKMIRNAGIPLKVENRAGKMHMKTMIIDDKYTIIGSMNFSKAGESYNDENILIITNSALSAKFKSHFNYLWKTIPDKWLYKTPKAESKDSINSCFDGIDNDFDGKIDMEDDSCSFKKKKYIKK